MTTTHIVTEPGNGAGPPLVLVHGVGLDHTMWDLTVAGLLARLSGPSAVVRYDLYGHGRSAMAMPESAGSQPTMESFVEQLLQVTAHVFGCPGSEAETSQGPDLVGLSLGGAIVRGAAARHPERFGRVVVANTVFNRTPDQRRGNLERLRLAVEKGMDPIADLAINRWFTEDFIRARPDRVETVRARLASTDLAGYLPAYRAFVDGDPAMPALLSAMTNEALFLTGARDTGSTPAMTEAMAELVAGATAIVMADTGHLPPIERPDEFITILTDFLERPRQ